jgi:hypothetical protein
MTDRELSQLQQEYRLFFLEKLRYYGVNSPADLTKERKSEFFAGIKLNWAKIKHEKNRSNILPANKTIILSDHQTPAFNKKITAASGESFYRTPSADLFQNSREIIRSQPNPEQTAVLKIRYAPNRYFEQGRDYHYPVVKMPVTNSSLKLPRAGRSNQKGYKEKDFFDQLILSFTDFEFTDNVHMAIPYFSRPYEPDIVLFDKQHNLYIDIEIDEPYDGYFRYPTHNLRSEEEQKQDNIRDLFFTESGWIVIRFTEKQVHCQTDKCIVHIRNVLNSIYKSELSDDSLSFKEDQWDDNQSIRWQKTHYREKYLGISNFQKQHSLREIKIDAEEPEDIEQVIKRTKKFTTRAWIASIAFDEETHKYLHPKDETGNAEFISVTTLIERFFPFDLKRYIERKAQEEGRSEKEILLEYLSVRDEAADKGTFLHTQIENFFKGTEFDAESKEFRLFTNFYHEQILKRKLSFFDAEKMIFSKRYNVAGTIDCLFKKQESDEHVMIDWKRSKKLIIDDRPRMFGYGYALSELGHLDNSSYYRYCLQQNIYKIIVESEFSIKISSMRLVVLHENYASYHVVKVPDMKREAMIILNSLNLKI